MPSASVPALISVALVSLLSFSGAALLALGPKRLQQLLPPLVALSAGALLGNAFLHLLPQASEVHHGFGGLVAWTTLAALLGFFLVESVIHWHHHGEDVDGPAHAHARQGVSSFAWMNLLGDGLHNFVDGLLIAGTWMASPAAGLVTTVAIALHEIPQEFGDFGVLLSAGLPVRRALLLNALSAATAIVGALVILLAGGRLGIEPYLLPVAAGGFIYVACADLVPEIHRRARGWNLVTSVAALGLGILLVAVLPVLVGEGHAHDGPGHEGHADPGASRGEVDAGR
ncbi:MAG: ZIP family metal transporter [Planctomycetota bacterium]